VDGVPSFLFRWQTLLSTGTTRFWAHVQHGLRYRPARFARIASDQRKLCRPVREQADAVTRWLVQECGLGIPTVVISVTGGAQALVLSQEVSSSART
jgi:hypothetical protein